MNINRYLVVGKRNRYAKPSARLTVTSPSLESYEVAIKLSLDIPDALFSRPQLEASIKIPSDALTAPVIEAETIDNIQSIISKELGVDLTVALVKEA